MKIAILTIGIVAGLMSYSPAPASAMDCCGTGQCRCSPFGSYCKGSQWGWYGAEKSVTSAGEAEKMIKSFFLPEKVRVTNLQDKSAFFEAEVRGPDNAVIDMVIVDKRTGRIRSIY